MLLTIFTPTYNRSDKLERTFESLCAQGHSDFEWLIVDDGSTDDTYGLVQKFILKAPFPVHYHYCEHGGKHRVYNEALSLAQGDYFFAVDSDDWLSAGCLNSLKKHLPIADKSVIGIIGLKEDSSGRIFGEHFGTSANVTTLQRLEEAGCKGERSFIFKTKIARRYRFPTIEGESFVTESVVYDRIGADWKFLTINRPLTVCEYQKDGLSGNIYQLMWNNPQGFAVYHSQRINQAKNLSKAVRHTLRYHAFRHIAGRRFRAEKYSGRYSVLVRLLSFVGPLGRLYYKYKCRTATLKQ